MMAASFRFTRIIKQISCVKVSESRAAMRSRESAAQGELPGRIFTLKFARTTRPRTRCFTCLSCAVCRRRIWWRQKVDNPEPRTAYIKMIKAKAAVHSGWFSTGNNQRLLISGTAGKADSYERQHREYPPCD